MTPTLTDYQTGAPIRPATREEWQRSKDAATNEPGGIGAFLLDGRAVFVSGDFPTPAPTAHTPEPTGERKPSHAPVTCRPPRRIPEGYGTRSIVALRHAVTRGLRMHEDGGIILPSGKRPSTRVDRDGYRSIHLGYGGKSCKITLARAICFLCNGEPPHPGYVVDHINGIKTDDRPENLRWATYEENTLNGQANRATGHTPQRIAACLAACAGIADPSATLASIAGFLEDVARGCDPDEARAIAADLLALLGEK